MYYEYFYLGKLVRSDEHPDYAKLKTLETVGITPAVSAKIRAEDLARAAAPIFASVLPGANTIRILEENGIFLEPEVMVIHPLKITPQGRRLIKILSEEWGYDIIDNMGRFCTESDL